MGSFSLFAVLLLLLLLAGGGNAARIYPKSNNETTPLVPTRVLQRLADTNESGSDIITYSAVHKIQGGKYYGVSVTMDVYDFLLTDDQYSLAVVRIFNAESEINSNSIEMGWEVSPKTYGGDSRAHLIAAWSTDGFGPKSCLNTYCPGFQPESGAPIVLGDVIEHVSQPNGVRQNMTIKLVKDSASGDWLVYCGFNRPDTTLIGRYPKSLFTDGLADGANHIYIGAVVLAQNTGLVPMGSGYLPTNHSMAASFSNIQVIDQNGQASLVNHDLPGYMDQPDMYSISPVINGQFFYGGPYRTSV